MLVLITSFAIIEAGLVYTIYKENNKLYKYILLFTLLFVFSVSIYLYLL